MMMDTIRPDMYSNLPCPKGCFVSGFIPANLNPMRVMSDEPASERLLKASAVIAMEPASVPARSLPANRRIFRKIQIS